MPLVDNQITRLEQAIAILEAHRSMLGDALLELVLAPLRGQLAEARGEVATPPALSLVGERRLVTMMFVDLTGFTALSEQFDPEYVRNLMNACFDHLVPVIHKYQGMVERFVGDAIMALFGAPVAHENDPERALRAALDLMDAMAAFNRQQDAELQVHIGVNTGLVVAGGLGARGRQVYSVMGDAANLASRLQDAAEPGEIWVGPDTYRLTALLFDFEPLPPIRIKGKAEPVAPYRLLGRKATPGPERGIEGLRSPLLGRDAELARLCEAFGALQHGHGRIVAITGEAGLGKTRLVAEARRTLPAGVTWVECHGLPHTEDISYWTARELLGCLADVTVDTPPREVGQALYTSVERLFPGQIAAVYPYLARLFDVPLPDALEDEVRYLGAEALHGRINQAVSRFVRAHALVQPLALVWDDLHWADPSSLKVLDVLLPLCAEVPLLLVLVFRADEPRVARFHHASARTYSERYHAIELGALGHADSARLLNSLLQVEHWSEETLTLMLQKAEGNPFYLEELLRTLIDSGVVVIQDNRAVMVHAAETLHVPDTLQGVIMARIDRLAAVDRRILQTAAVIGRVFSYQVLAQLLEPEIGTTQLDQSLMELQRRAFLRPRDAGAAPDTAEAPAREYSFRHAMTHEATYHSLLIAWRQELHRRAGEAIEALFPDQLDELAPTLGYHFERAEQRDKAIHYLVQAGDHARAIYANAEASAFYRAALEQVRRLPGAAPVVETQLSEHLGDVLLLRGQYDEAGAAYEGASAVIARHDPIWQARLHRKVGKVREAQRRYDEAWRAYDLAETELGAEPGEPDLRWGQEWIQIQIERLWLHYWLAQWQEMGEFAEQLRPVVERFGLPVQRAAFFIQSVNLNLRRDRYVISAATLAYCEAAVYASEEAGDLDAMTWARFALGGSRLFRGDLDEAEVQLQTALALAERSGDIAHQARCWTYLALISRKRGRVEAARRAAARSLEVATAGQMLEYIAVAHANQAWAAWRLGDQHAAQERARAALELWQQIRLVYPLQWTALFPLIAVAAAEDRRAAAVDYARALLAPTQQRLPDTLAEATGTIIALWEGGDAEGTRAAIAQALALAEKDGYA